MLRAGGHALLFFNRGQGFSIKDFLGNPLQGFFPLLVKLCKFGEIVCLSHGGAGKHPGLVKGQAPGKCFKLAFQ